MALQGKVVKFVYLLTGTHPVDPADESTIYFSPDGHAIYVGDEQIVGPASFLSAEEFDSRFVPVETAVNQLNHDMYSEESGAVIYDIKETLASTPSWQVINS